MSGKEYYKVTWWCPGLGDYISTVGNIMRYNSNYLKNELNILFDPSLKQHTSFKNGSKLDIGEHLMLNLFETTVNKINYIVDPSIIPTPVTTVSTLTVKKQYIYKSNKTNIFCYSFLTGEKVTRKQIPIEMQQEFFKTCEKNKVTPVCVDYPMPIFEAIELMQNSIGLLTPHSALCVISHYCKCPSVIFIPIPHMESVNIDGHHSNIYHEINCLKDMDIIQKMIDDKR